VSHAAAPRLTTAHADLLRQKSANNQAQQRASSRKPAFPAAYPERDGLLPAVSGAGTPSRESAAKKKKKRISSPSPPRRATARRATPSLSVKSSAMPPPLKRVSSSLATPLERREVSWKPGLAPEQPPLHPRRIRVAARSSYLRSSCMKLAPRRWRRRCCAQQAPYRTARGPLGGRKGAARMRMRPSQHTATPPAPARRGGAGREDVVVRALEGAPI